MQGRLEVHRLSGHRWPCCSVALLPCQVIEVDADDADDADAWAWHGERQDVNGCHDVTTKTSKTIQDISIGYDSV